MESQTDMSHFKVDLLFVKSHIIAKYLTKKWCPYLYRTLGKHRHVCEEMRWLSDRKNDNFVESLTQLTPGTSLPLCYTAALDELCCSRQPGRQARADFRAQI